MERHFDSLRRLAGLGGPVRRKVGVLVVLAVTGSVAAACGSHPSTTNTGATSVSTTSGTSGGGGGGGGGGTGGGGGQTTTTSAATTTSAGAPTTTSGGTGTGGLGGNSYFPLVTGATWTYRFVSGPDTGKTETVTVTGSSQTAGGQLFTTRISLGSNSLTGQYLLAANGSIRVEASTDSGGVTISGAGSFWVPSGTQLTSCSPCTYSASFTGVVMGHTVPETMAQSVTSLGTATVTTPAGTFQTERLGFRIDVKGTMSGLTVDMVANYDIYLAHDVGIVETGNGTATVTVMGHSTSEPSGEMLLISYHVP